MLLKVPDQHAELGFTFGASFSSPHVPIHEPPDRYVPHLVENRCNGHVVSVNNLVAKWRRSADSLLCLPSPPLLSVSSVYVPLFTTRWRDEAGVLFVTGFPQSMKKKRK